MCIGVQGERVSKRVSEQETMRERGVREREQEGDRVRESKRESNTERENKRRERTGERE